MAALKNAGLRHRDHGKTTCRGRRFRPVRSVGGRTLHQGASPQHTPTHQQSLNNSREVRVRLMLMSARPSAAAAAADGRSFTVESSTLLRNYAAYFQNIPGEGDHICGTSDEIE
jgi:hypothetical protein